MPPAGHKVTDEKGDLRPLGPEARKNVFNLTLKPSGKSVLEFDWPPFLETPLGVGAGRVLQPKLYTNAQGWP